MNQKHEIGLTYYDVEITVVGFYSPAYAGRMYYPDGSGEPPEPASFEIDKILICEETDIMPLFEEMPQKFWDKLEAMCLEQVQMEDGIDD